MPFIYQLEIKVKLLISKGFTRTQLKIYAPNYSCILRTANRVRQKQGKYLLHQTPVRCRSKVGILPSAKASTQKKAEETSVGKKWWRSPLHNILRKPSITFCCPRFVFSDVLFQTHFSEEKTFLFWKALSSFSNSRADRNTGGLHILGHSLGVYLKTLSECWLVGCAVITEIWCEILHRCY